MPIRRRSAYTCRVFSTSSPSTQRCRSTWASGDEVDRAIDALEQRGLARVGRADDPEDLCRGIVERDAVERRLRPVADRQIANGDVVPIGSRSPPLARPQVNPQADREQVDADDQPDQHHGRAVLQTLGHARHLRGDR